MAICDIVLTIIVAIVQCESTLRHVYTEQAIRRDKPSLATWTHHREFRIKQGCIPVGCVPPAAVAVGRRGGLHNEPPGTMHLPLDHAPPGPCTPPKTMHPPGPCTPSPTPPVDRHTPVNIYYIAPNFVCGR